MRAGDQGEDACKQGVQTVTDRAKVQPHVRTQRRAQRAGLQSPSVGAKLFHALVRVVVGQRRKVHELERAKRRGLQFTHAGGS